MFRFRCRYAAVVCAFLFRLSGQTPDTAIVHGRATDQSHAALKGVEVQIRNSLTGFTRGARTNSAGDFSVSGLPVAGWYEITINQAGFAGAHLGDLALAAGATAEVNLELAVQGRQTEITVNGAVGEVRTDMPQLGIRLESAQAREMSLLGRKITSLPLLSAANRPAINQRSSWTAASATTVGGGRRFSAISRWMRWTR